MDENRPWQFTDDTQLTLATCEALLDAGGVRPDVIAAHFARWFVQGRVTGLGASTLKALRDLQFGAHWALSGARGDSAAGNGAAMRITPLAFLLDAQNAGSRDLVRDVCRITHHHDEAYVGALAVLLAVQDALNDRPIELAGISDRLPDSRVRDRLRDLSGQPPEDIPGIARQFGASGFVVESVPLALYAAAQGPTLGFGSVLGRIMTVAGDTDTIAAIAGSVMGAAVGHGALPVPLLARLPAQPDLAVFGRFAQWVAQTG